MKNAVCLLLGLLIALSFPAVSPAEDRDEIPGTVEVLPAGFRFVPPEGMRDTAGIVLMDGAAEIRDGVWYAVWTYYAMTEAEREAWIRDPDPDAPAESRVSPLFFLLSLGNGMTFRSFNALNGNAIPTAYVRELGKAGDTTFILYMEGPNPSFIEAIDPVYRDEYAALAGAADDVAAAFSFFARQEAPDPYAGLTGSLFAFTTADLDGNPVSSAELFAQNELTVVNIWTTWCAPCVHELAELQALHERLREKGCGVVGMLADDDTDAARRLAAENGVAYPVILAPDALEGFLRLESVPTTLFVGRDGTVLAPPVVGADPEEYEAVVRSLLPD